MHLSCPYCTSIFDVRRHDLGDTGKSVQCGICEHQWFVDPSFYADVPETDADLSVDIYLDDSAPPSLAYDAGGLSIDQLPAGAMPSLASLYRESSKRSRFGKSLITVAWIVLIVTTMTTLSYGILERDFLVENFPALSKIYRSVNLNVDEHTNIEAFMVKDINISVQFINLERRLNIQGSIINITDATHIIPTLYVSLTNVFGVEIYSTRILPAQEILSGGESFVFDYTIFDFPENSADIIMLFLNRSENLYSKIKLDSTAILEMLQAQEKLEIEKLQNASQTEDETL